eukprot:273299-Amorphochlora_amoeboformis.AAC.1
MRNHPNRNRHMPAKTLFGPRAVRPSLSPPCLHHQGLGLEIKLSSFRNKVMGGSEPQQYRVFRWQRVRCAKSIEPGVTPGPPRPQQISQSTAPEC